LTKLLIGYGNPLRSDDSIGQRIASFLLQEKRDFEVIVAHQLLPEFAEDISRFDFVLFVDASISVPCGELRFCDILGNDKTELDTHFLTPSSLLELAKELYGLAPKASIAEIGICDDSLGEGLSEELESRLYEYIEKILLKMSEVSFYE